MYMLKRHGETKNIMLYIEDGLHVEVIQDTSGFATVYWWNQANEDNQMHIIVTNVTAGTQNQFESQHEVRVFYLPMHLIDCETYTVKVIGKTTHREGEVTFWAGNANSKCCIA